MTYVSQMLDRTGRLFPSGGEIPRLPTKLEDRIPIHISDMKTFAGCRRQWNWSSPLRRGLQPGILPKPLQLGQAVHIAMEKGYMGCLGESQMHFDYDTALGAFYKAMDARKVRIEQKMGPMWEDEQKDFDEMERLGAAMILHYSLWIPPYDRVHRMTHAEQLFRVPLPGTDKICYEGRFDGIVRADDGKLYILEYKTTASMARMSGVFRGIQATMYAWAASQIFGEVIHGVVYRVLLKKIPHVPELTTQGRFSRAKSQKLTKEWVTYCLEQMAEKRAVRNSDEHTTPEDLERVYQDYFRKLKSAAYDLYGMLESKPNEFFMHRRIPRGPTAIQHAIQALTAEGLRMSEKDVPIYPITGFHCSWCQYRDPCDLLEEDYIEAAEGVLEAEYEKRTYWEDDLDLEED